MIEIKDVVKYYGNRQVLKSISFRVEDGQIAGLLGPNGAGKSTTMNILAGFLSPTEGEVWIQGYDIMTSPLEGRSQIGYLPETPPLYDDMTVEEYLDFIGRLKGIKDKDDRKKAIDELAEKTGIAGVTQRLIGNLSKGFRQRVGLAQALIGDPPVLILDEPAGGLDPGQIIEIRELIRKLGGDHTIILSSHLLSELQAVCDKVIIMVDGEIALDDRPAHLARSYGDQGRILLTVKGEPEALSRLLEEAGFVEEFTFIPEPEARAGEKKKSETRAGEKKKSEARDEEKKEPEAETKEKKEPEARTEEKKEPEAKTQEKKSGEDSGKEESLSHNQKKKKKKKGKKQDKTDPVTAGTTRELRLSLKLKDGDQSRDQLFYLLARKKMPIIHMEEAEMSLEDVFVRLINEYNQKREEGKEE